MKDPRITKVPRSQWQEGVEIPLDEMSPGESLEVRITFRGALAAKITVDRYGRMFSTTFVGAGRKRTSVSAFYPGDLPKEG